MIVITSLGATESLIKEAVDYGLNYYRFPLLCANPRCYVPEKMYDGIVEKSKMYIPPLIPASIMPSPVISIPYIPVTKITITPELQLVPTLLAEQPKAVYYGNPGKSQFPGDNYNHNLARSVWDMQYHKGRIYIGYGDSWGNQGPINVQSVANNETGFRQEITIMEESCYLLREYENKLIIPGTDACGDTQGAIYIKNDIWKTISIYATHIVDACYSDNALYTILTRGQSSLLMKADGNIWKTLLEFPTFNDGFFGCCFPFDDCVVFETSEKSNQYFYRVAKDDKIEKLFSHPSYSVGASIYRSVRYKNGYLLVFSYPLHVQYAPYPLYFFTLNNITMVDFFRNTNVRDIVVRDYDIYVLTAEVKNSSFWGYIYHSSDMKNWELLSSFNLTSMPNSMELLETTFYVGTCIKEINDTIVESDSGSIYKIQMNPSGPAPVGVLHF